MVKSCMYNTYIFFVITVYKAIFMGLVINLHILLLNHYTQTNLFRNVVVDLYSGNKKKCGIFFPYVIGKGYAIQL
jgi:hypothetical protein